MLSKMCIYEVKIQCYQLKWCYNVKKKLDYLQVFYSS
jgi:hypothetical protein